MTAAEAVEYAIADLSEQLSAFGERELKVVALRHGLGSVTPEQIDLEMASPSHGLVVDDTGGRKVFTTEALLAEERYIVGQAARGRGAACPVGVPDGLTPQLADGTRLNDEQWQVTQGLLNSSNRVSMVKGPAGAGKSYSLQKFDEGMRMAGETATYLATHGASRQGAGQGWLRRENRRPFSPRSEDAGGRHAAAASSSMRPACSATRTR